MKKIFLSIITICLLIVSLVAKPIVSANVNAAPEKATETAKSYVLMAEDGQVLKEKNVDEKLPIASMTKIMTLILAFDELDKNNLTLDEKIIASETAASMGGSQVFIEEGGEYTVDSLIKSIVVASGNDASVLIAERIAGSEEDFVKRMNEKVSELGLKNTHFKNCTGLPAADHYSSAIDCAKMFKELTNHKQYFNYSQIWLDKIEHPNNRFTELANTNKLLKQYPSCDAGKTGSTSEAGFCISASAVKNDMRLYAVVVGAETSKDRFNKTKELFNYGFDNFTKSVIVPSDFNVTAEIENGKQKLCVARAEEPFVSIVKKGEKQEIDTKVLISKNFAPISEGEQIGEVLCIKNGEVVKTIKLISTINVKKLGYYDYLKKALSKYYF